jgi:hypothetical protein
MTKNHLVLLVPQFTFCTLLCHSEWDFRKEAKKEAALRARYDIVEVSGRKYCRGRNSEDKWFTVNASRWREDRRLIRDLLADLENGK